MQAQVEANKEIANLGYEEANLTNSKANKQEKKSRKPKEQRKPYQPQQQKLNLIQKQRLGLQKTSGLVQDTAMTYTAFDLHKN